MVRVVGLGSSGPELKSRSADEIIPGGVNSTSHPSEVGKMSASMLVYCVGVVTRPGLCPIAKETAYAASALCTEYSPNLLLVLCRYSAVSGIKRLKKRSAPTSTGCIPFWGVKPAVPSVVDEL